MEALEDVVLWVACTWGPLIDMRHEGTKWPVQVQICSLGQNLFLMCRQAVCITMPGDLMQRGSSSVSLSASLQVHEDIGSK